MSASDDEEAPQDGLRVGEDCHVVRQLEGVQSSFEHRVKANRNTKNIYFGGRRHTALITASEEFRSNGDAKAARKKYVRLAGLDPVNNEEDKAELKNWNYQTLAITYVKTDENAHPRVKTQDNKVMIRNPYNDIKRWNRPRDQDKDGMMPEFSQLYLIVEESALEIEIPEFILKRLQNNRDLNRYNCEALVALIKAKMEEKGICARKSVLEELITIPKKNEDPQARTVPTHATGLVPSGHYPAGHGQPLALTKGPAAANHPTYSAAHSTFPHSIPRQIGDGSGNPMTTVITQVLALGGQERTMEHQEQMTNSQAAEREREAERQERQAKDQAAERDRQAAERDREAALEREEKLRTESNVFRDKYIAKVEEKSQATEEQSKAAVKVAQEQSKVDQERAAAHEKQKEDLQAGAMHKMQADIKIIHETVTPWKGHNPEARTADEATPNSSSSNEVNAIRTPETSTTGGAPPANSNSVSFQSRLTNAMGPGEEKNKAVQWQSPQRNDATLEDRGAVPAEEPPVNREPNEGDIVNADQAHLEVNGPELEPPVDPAVAPNDPIDWINEIMVIGKSKEMSLAEETTTLSRRNGWSPIPKIAQWCLDNADHDVCLHGTSFHGCPVGEGWADAKNKEQPEIVELILCKSGCPPPAVVAFKDMDGDCKQEFATFDQIGVEWKEVAPRVYILGIAEGGIDPNCEQKWRLAHLFTLGHSDIFALDTENNIKLGELSGFQFFDPSDPTDNVGGPECFDADKMERDPAYAQRFVDGFMDVFDLDVQHEESVRLAIQARVEQRRRECQSVDRLFADYPREEMKSVRSLQIFPMESPAVESCNPVYYPKPIAAVRVDITRVELENILEENGIHDDNVEANVNGPAPGEDDRRDNAHPEAAGANVNGSVPPGILEGANPDNAAAAHVAPPAQRVLQDAHGLLDQNAGAGNDLDVLVVEVAPEPIEGEDVENVHPLAQMVGFEVGAVREAFVINPETGTEYRWEYVLIENNEIDVGREWFPVPRKKDGTTWCTQCRNALIAGRQIRCYQYVQQRHSEAFRFIRWAV